MSEIKVLRPELVVLVERSASDTIGSESERENGGTYFRVPFPTKRRSSQDVEKAMRLYNKLHAKLNA
jgi:hypothetical protein